MPREFARAMLRPDVAEERVGMNDGDADKAAILMALQAETDAWLQSGLRCDWPRALGACAGNSAR